MNRLMNAGSARPARMLAASAAMAAVLGGVTACSDSAGPESGEVTTEDLQSLEDDLTTLEDRVGTLEGEDPAAEDVAGEEQAEIVGQDVTVSAEVSELITTSDVGSAFRIAGDSGPSVAVLATTPPEGLDANDVVQISGTVQVVNRDSFEEDFGIAEDDLFDDPDGFFEDAEGQPAISATSIEVLQEQGDE